MKWVLEYKDQWRIQELTEGGGADFRKNLYTPQLALICYKGVRGHAPSGKFCNLMPQLAHFRPFFGRNMVVFLFWGPWTGGGALPGSATEDLQMFGLKLNKYKIVKTILSLQFISLQYILFRIVFVLCKVPLKILPSKPLFHHVPIPRLKCDIAYRAGGCFHKIVYSYLLMYRCECWVLLETQ